MKWKFVHALVMMCLFSAVTARAQTVLTADGPGNTYERINSVLAPGYNVVEHPECAHAAFGRHIAEVFDADLNQYVFEFYAHVNEDNDRCINFDRQRVEIKTYDQSPDSLIGTTGEFITYKWRFKIPVGFKPSSSFTHIHQIKPVNGDDDQPLFTLTVRKGTPNKLELIHVVSGTSGSTKVSIVNLSSFEGVWVEATEQILVGLNGTYSMDIRRVSDGASLMNYTNNNINTIRGNNDFIRPKWGIYRSLNTPADLRDESLRFSYFSIKEGLEVLPAKIKSFNAIAAGNKVLLKWTAAEVTNTSHFIVERSGDGIVFDSVETRRAINSNAETNYTITDITPLAGNNFYRLKVSDHNGRFVYSENRLVKLNSSTQLFIYPNPVTTEAKILLPASEGDYILHVFSADGKLLLNTKTNLPNINTAFNYFLPQLKNGVYQLHMQNETMQYRQTFLKQ